MKKANKFLSVFLALMMVISIIPMANIEAEAASNIVINGVDIGYAHNDYFTKNGKSCANSYWAKGRCHKNGVCEDATHSQCNCMRYWPTGKPSTCKVDLKSSQCFGFARYCQWKVYGYHDGTNTSKFTNLGGLASSSCTAAKLKNLLLGCAPATHVRTEESGKGYGHSISIISTNNDGAVVADANSNGYCIVKKITYTWSELAAFLKGYGGVDSAYAYKGYSPVNSLSIKYDANGGTIAGSNKTYNVYKVVSSAGVNLRSGAGTNYGTLVTIPQNATFVVTATASANGYTWGKTTYDGDTGWCVISEDWTTKTGTQPQTKYYLNSSDMVYKSSTGKVMVQEMLEGKSYDNGLYNYTTFEITRKGYTFKGWGTKASGGTVYSQSESMTAKKLCSTIGDGDKTITLYAIWAPNELSVHYNANGGKVSLNEFTLSSGLIYKNNQKFVQTWQYNVAKDNGLINSKSFGLERTGYQFTGWGTTSAGGTIFDQNDTGLLPTEINSNLKNGNCSTTLYALWNSNTYTVKYNANGGTGTVSNSSHTYDTSKTLNANKFIRTGYTFLGWSTSSTATVAKYTDKQSVKNLTSSNGGTVTLYAVWSKNEHTPGMWTVVTPATCTSTGLTRVRCTACGEIIAEKELPVAEHSASGWVVTTGATCTVDGMRQKTCTVCGEIILKEEIPATGHTTGKWEVVTEATCTTEGSKNQKCTVCKEIIDTEEIPTTDHILGEWITVVEPTCETKGIKIQYCVDCGLGLTNEEILATGHRAGSWETVTESGCITVGSKVQKCTVCQAVLALEGTSSVGHTASEWIVVTEATCTTVGERQKNCTVCDETLVTEEISATGHTVGEWETVTSATCNEKGLQVQNCIGCGVTLATKELDVTEHIKGDWEVIAQPTCTLNGLKVQSCSACGETISTEEIATTEHIEGTWKVAIHSTCSAIGFKIQQCTECGEVLQTEEIPEKEHTFANGICLVCSETDPSYVLDSPEEYSFSIQKPSRTEIRHKDGIKLHANIEGTAPAGSYVVWTTSNGNFKTEEINGGDSLKIVSDSNGKTTFTATLYSAEGEILATDTIEMKSKAGFFDKIGSFFRSLFGGIKIYEN